MWIFYQWRLATRHKPPLRAAMREGGRMPWYPSVELFRQERIGEWDGVIGRLAGRLREFSASRGAV